MYSVRNVWGHEKFIKIEWNLGKRCNYDCSYCPSVIHDNFSKHTDLEIIKLAIDKFKEFSKPVRLSFTGGEPTVHPYFSDIIEYVNQNNVNFISVTTNGTRLPDYYISLNVTQYVFSLHFEYDYNKVLQTIIKVFKHKPSLLVNIMAHHDYMVEVKNVVNLLEEAKIPYNIRRIRWTDLDHDDFDDNRYQPKDLDYVLKTNSTVKPNCVIDNVEYLHANDIIKLHKNKFKNFECNAGLESLMIDHDGSVYRATCRVGGCLGNIYKNTFIIPNTSVICTREFCTCAADIPLTKVLKQMT